ncbi:MAG: esterase family protein [Clostridia bacterium]|nr:esterase family protein [Clostridia bacterium]
MAFIDLRFYSEVLGMQTEAAVIIPQRSTVGQIGVETNAKPGAYKCLYLLHGLGGDGLSWMRLSSIERYALKYGICVVMPRADKSYYCNMRHGLNYYDHIAKEVPATVCELLNISDKREDSFIAGLSMGGYGALKIALREPQRFCAGAGLSPCGDIRSLKGFRKEFLPIFGEDEIIPDEDDALYLAEKQKDNPLRPRLYMGIGTEDFLYENANNLRRKIEECGYDFTYREGPGAHNWDFWDEYIRYVFEWLGNMLK